MGNALCNTSGLLETVIAEEEASPSYNLRGNMVRVVKDHDVYKDYSVVRVLGEGSMGSVIEARRKISFIHHSARQDRSKSPSSVARCLFGMVSGDYTKKAKRKDDDVTFAIKSIILDRITDDFLSELRNEIDILKTLDHPNVVRAYETFEHKRRIYIVMELCSGGDLHERSPYTEQEAAKIVTKLLSAVSYMHKMGVCHRVCSNLLLLFGKWLIPMVISRTSSHFQRRTVSQWALNCLKNFFFNFRPQ